MYFASQSFPFFPYISILNRSKVLIKDDAGGWSLIDDGYIVHGGDACDKGRYADESHSIRLTATIEILRTIYATLFQCSLPCGTN